MLVHDHESIEKERVELLDAVQNFYSLPGIGGIGEDLLPILKIGRDEHHGIVLMRMPLPHGSILADRR